MLYRPFGEILDLLNQLMLDLKTSEQHFIADRPQIHILVLDLLSIHLFCRRFGSFCEKTYFKLLCSVLYRLRIPPHTNNVAKS